MGRNHQKNAKKSPVWSRCKAPDPTAWQRHGEGRATPQMGRNCDFWVHALNTITVTKTSHTTTAMIARTTPAVAARGTAVTE